MTRPIQAAHSYSNDGIGAPSSAAAISSLNYRVQQLEQRLHSGVSVTPELDLETAVWGKEFPSVSTSPKYRVRTGGLLYGFYVDLRVAASSGDTTVDLYLDGSNIGSVTLAAGVDNGFMAFNTTVNSSSTFYVDCTAAGIDAEGLAAQARMK